MRLKVKTGGGALRIVWSETGQVFMFTDGETDVPDMLGESLLRSRPHIFSLPEAPAPEPPDVIIQPPSQFPDDEE